MSTYCHSLTDKNKKSLKKNNNNNTSRQYSSNSESSKFPISNVSNRIPTPINRSFVPQSKERTFRSVGSLSDNDKIKSSSMHMHDLKSTSNYDYSDFTNKSVFNIGPKNSVESYVPFDNISNINNLSKNFVTKDENNKGKFTHTKITNPNHESVPTLDYKNSSKPHIFSSSYFYLNFNEFPTLGTQTETDRLRDTNIMSTINKKSQRISVQGSPVTPVDVINNTINIFMERVNIKYYDFNSHTFQWDFGSHRLPPHKSDDPLMPESIGEDAFHGTITLHYDETPPYQGYYFLQLNSNHNSDDDIVQENRRRFDSYFMTLIDLFNQYSTSTNTVVVTDFRGWNKRYRDENYDQNDSCSNSSSNKCNEKGRDNPSKELRSSQTSPSIMPPMFRAAIDGNISQMKSILSTIFPSNNSSSIVSKTNQSLINCAFLLSCRSGHVQIFDLLLSYGADVNTKYSRYGGTCLLYALKNGYTEIIQKLVNFGADVNCSHHKGRSYLHIAIANKDLSTNIIKLLVNAGADVNSCDDNKWTPLHTAVANKRTEIITYLVEDVGADLTIKNSSNLTPYSMANQRGYNNICEFLSSVNKANDILKNNIIEDTNNNDNDNDNIKVEDMTVDLKPLNDRDNFLFNTIYLIATRVYESRDKVEIESLPQVADELFHERYFMLDKIQQQGEDHLIKMLSNYKQRYEKHHLIPNIEVEKLQISEINTTNTPSNTDTKNKSANSNKSLPTPNAMMVLSRLPSHEIVKLLCDGANDNTIFGYPGNLFYNIQCFLKYGMARLHQKESKGMDTNNNNRRSSSTGIIPNLVQEVMTMPSQLITTLSWSNRQYVLQFLHNIISNDDLNRESCRRDDDGKLILDAIRVLCVEIRNYSTNENLYEVISSLFILTKSSDMNACHIMNNEQSIIPYLCDLIRDSPYDEREISRNAIFILKSLAESSSDAMNASSLVSIILKYRPNFFKERAGNRWNIPVRDNRGHKDSHTNSSNNKNHDNDKSKVTNAKDMSKIDQWREDERIKRRIAVYEYLNSLSHLQQKETNINEKHEEEQDDEVREKNIFFPQDEDLHGNYFAFVKMLNLKR